MKRFKLWSMIMLTMLTLPLVMACSSDDDVDLNTNSIVGHWKGYKYQIYEDENLTKLLYEEDDNTIEKKYFDYEFKFFDDGTCSYEVNHYNYTRDYKLLKKEIIIYYTSNRHVTYYIVEFTKNSMKIKCLFNEEDWLLISLNRVG